MAITSFRKVNPNRIFEERISSSINAYKKYTSIYKIPNEFEGNILLISFGIYKHYDLLVDYEVKLDLKFVRIYFDTTTFDTITKDSKVCGHAVSYWWDYGASNRILYNQWRGDSLLWSQDNFSDIYKRKSLKMIHSISFGLLTLFM